MLKKTKLRDLGQGLLTDAAFAKLVELEEKLKVKKSVKKEPTSRTGRWADFASKAQVALSDIKDLRDELASAIEGLVGLRDEYEEWKGNLPENLQSSALYDKLEEVTALDIDSCMSSLDSAIEEVEGAVDEAEGVDLPRGFGRD